MIKTIGLTKGFQHNQSVILRDIDLVIQTGKWSTIIGPSGSGKSTLLSCISGVLKPDIGKVYYDGTDIYALNDFERSKYRRTNIGFVFQDFKLLPYYSILDNVILPLMNDRPRKELIERGKVLLSKVGIGENMYKRLPENLSGGEKQRVAIARALIGNPKVLICDEPTGNLDIKNRDMIIDLFLRLKENNQTILMVTHDLEVARSSDYIHRLSDGKLFLMENEYDQVSFTKN
ncbi:ABC transporter ATP-binding protein [Cytobacillus horneckiae]|uniref:ABC transporter ATP-binding protein n=1 Tax=Cytobacillus horneckiae TaxID=549687 RepID=UPI0034CF3553